MRPPNRAVPGDYARFCPPPYPLGRTGFGSRFALMADATNGLQIILDILAALFLGHAVVYLGGQAKAPRTPHLAGMAIPLQDDQPQPSPTHPITTFVG